MLAVIIIPWAMFGAPIDRSIEQLLTETANRPALTMVIVVALLAADPLLPVPSSLVGVLAGAVLGVGLGALAVWLGLMAGCGLGYWLGARPGRWAAGRILTATDMAGLARVADGVGIVALAVTRPVPVLAEALVLLAGAAQMSPMRFLLVITPANAFTAFAYAGLGAFAGFGIPLLAGLAALPAIGLLLWQRERRR